MNDKSLLKKLLELWPFLTSLVVISIAYANLASSNSSQNVRINRLEDQQAASISTQSQIQVQLSQIQTDLQWIKSKFK